MADTGQHSDRLRVTCPGCDGELVIDIATGSVLSHEKATAPLAGGNDFDALLADVDSATERAAARFDRELGAIHDQERVLDAKFEEALRRAEASDDDEPPVRPWDLD